ncbi:MAG TPA: sulfatase, partial [Candidatus Dormibacteraeota bacterium]|nr:sulfatase [Candidatus Dormibacteraeota bacterium]
MPTPEEFLNRINRRHFFSRSSRGLGTLALASLLNPSIFAGPPRPAKKAGATRSAALAADTPDFRQFVPRAKRVIYLFQSGAPSQLDLYDYK